MRSGLAAPFTMRAGAAARNLCCTAISTPPAGATPLADPEPEVHQRVEQVTSLAEPARERSLQDFVDLHDFFSRLTEVAAWTSDDGAWQEHATFLLRTSDNQWHAVGFAEPAAAELMLYLGQLPGFNTGLLREVIGKPVRQMVTLWRRPVVPAPRRPSRAE